MKIRTKSTGADKKGVRWSSLNPLVLTKGALLYGVIPVCALISGLRAAAMRRLAPETPRCGSVCETEDPGHLECPGRFASQRSEQGAALPCAALRLSLQTWSAETVLQTIPADQVFIS